MTRKRFAVLVAMLVVVASALYGSGAMATATVRLPRNYSLASVLSSGILPTSIRRLTRMVRPMPPPTHSVTAYQTSPELLPMMVSWRVSATN